MASIVYDSFLIDALNGNANTTHSYKAFLVTGGYAEDRAHSKRSAATAFEVSGPGYTAGGVLVTISVTLNTSTHKATLSVSAAVWPSSAGLTARKMIVSRVRGGAASADELVCCVDNGVDLVSANAMTWNASNWEIPMPTPI
jgi:hypothetical protein